jgi:hypothetical protein
MNKFKIIYVSLFILFFVLIVSVFFKIKKQEEFRQKIVLAHEIRKVLDHLMSDMYQARQGSFEGLPADGLWHKRIAFIETGQGALEYLIKEGHLLRISKGSVLVIADDIADICLRRHVNSPDILEVRIKAQKNVSLTSNLRIRILHN